MLAGFDLLAGLGLLTDFGLLGGIGGRLRIQFRWSLRASASACACASASAWTCADSSTLSAVPSSIPGIVIKSSMVAPATIAADW